MILVSLKFFCGSGIFFKVSFNLKIFIESICIGLESIDNIGKQRIRTINGKFSEHLAINKLVSVTVLIRNCDISMVVPASLIHGIKQHLPNW
jgi:hypothetical protein